MKTLPALNQVSSTPEKTALSAPIKVWVRGRGLIAYRPPSFSTTNSSASSKK